MAEARNATVMWFRKVPADRAQSPLLLAILYHPPHNTHPIQGLRLHDNPALLEACKSTKYMYPIFVLDPFFLTNSSYK